MILGDDDRHLTERERPLPNAGREAATEAAKAVGGIAAFPAFKQGPNAERTDFNDLQKTEGVKTVEIQLAHEAERFFNQTLQLGADVSVLLLARQEID